MSGQGKTLTWNAANQPTTITANGVTEGYDYDADGQRLVRSVGGVTTVYVGDSYEEDLPSGTTRTVYTLNGQTIAQRTTTGSTSSVLYLHSDQLGSVSAATNANGALVSRQDYGPWGNVRSGGIAETTRNFTGQRRDGTGLLFYNARCYDPALARFVSADTIGFDLKQPQSTNRYSYVLNNPLKYTDPTGQCAAPNRNNPDIQEENARCRALQIQLGDYGYTIENLLDWQSWELQLILQGTLKFVTTANWSVNDFKSAVGPVTLIRNDVVRDSNGNSVFALSGETNGTQWIKISDAMMADGANDPSNNIKFTLITELAHKWDRRAGLSSAFSTNKEVKADYEHVGHDTSNPAEDFAQSVATNVYGPRSNNIPKKRYEDGQRYQYIKQLFRQYRTCEHSC